MRISIAVAAATLTLGSPNASPTRRRCSSGRARSTWSSGWTTGRSRRSCSQCRGAVRAHRRSRSAHRGAPLQFPEHTKEVLRGGRAHGRRHRRVRRDLHQGPAARLPPRPVRPAHDHQHPGRPRARREVQRALHAGRPGDRGKASAQVLHERPHAGRVQDLSGKMDAVDPTRPRSRSTWAARARWRTDLYASCGTLLTHDESIELIKRLGVEVHARAQGRRAWRCRSTATTPRRTTRSR